MLKFLPYLHESRMDFWNAPTIYSNDRRFVITPFILQPCIGDVLFIASSTMQRWRGVWNILRTVENFLRSLSDNLSILRENIRVYWFDEKVDFLSFLRSNKILARFVLQFLKRVAFPSIPIFFSHSCLAVDVSSLTFQPRVCTSPRFSPRSFLLSFSRFFSFPSSSFSSLA